jgi:hypothetical protein
VRKEEEEEEMKMIRARKAKGEAFFLVAGVD